MNKIIKIMEKDWFVGILPLVFGLLCLRIPNQRLYAWVAIGFVFLLAIPKAREMYRKINRDPSEPLEEDWTIRERWMYRIFGGIWGVGMGLLVVIVIWGPR